MKILGLTGSIAMGKTTVGKQFEVLGAKRICSDAIVHQLMLPGNAGYNAIRDFAPEVVIESGVDRSKLGKKAFADPAFLHTLEAALHPLVVAVQHDFIYAQQRLGAKLVVLDIPLLYETGAEARCDAVAVVTAPAFIQRQRAFRREAMTEEKFHSILARQMPDRDKRQQADYLIPTSLGRAFSFAQTARIYKELTHA